MKNKHHVFLKRVIVGLIVVLMLGVAYWLISPLWRSIWRSDPLPVVTDAGSPPTSVLKQTDFVPSAHEVKGRALLLQTGEKRFLRFEDFNTVNGPDLRIYLAADLEAKDYVDLGEIRATQGSVNYELPKKVDLTRYNKVLVWCRAFHVLFSYAEL